MIHFVEIEIEGFGAIVNKKTYQLDSHKLTIIRGRNGAGKTTILLALVWALFGKSLKNKNQIETWPHKRPPSYKGTRVRLKFIKDGQECYITRCQNYSGKVNGSLGKNRVITEGFLEDLKGKRDIQKEINQFLGYSFELFVNSVVFGQKMRRLIDEDNSKKKKIMEDAFELAYIEKANDITSKSLKDLQTKILEQSNEVDKINSEINLVKLKIDNVVTVYENKLESYKTTLKAYRSNLNKVKEEKPKKSVWDEQKIISDMDKLTKQIKSFKHTMELYQKYDKEEFLLKNKIDTREYEVQVLADKYSLLKQKLAKPQKSICSECGAPLSKAQSVEHSKKELEKLKELHTQGTKEIKKLKAEHTKIKNLVGDTKAASELIKENEKKLANLDKILKEIDKEKAISKNYKKNLKAAKKLIKDHKLNKPKKPNTTELDATHTELRSKLNSAEKYYDTLSKERELHLWALKDPLSNKGLKMYIFDTMLGKLNQALSKYERLIGFGIDCEIDLSTANKDLKVIITRDKQFVNYEDLSGGESQIVNIVLAFALHDTISENKECNLLFLDEVFESLDSENVQLVTELIEQKSQNKNVHLITHLESFNPYNAHTLKI